VRLFVLAALVGCGFQPRAAQTVDAAADVAAVTRDAPPDGPTDTDGDGVPDVVDNCPSMPNADQRDHDVDGRGDVCDLCPHIPEAFDLDSDGDGVGNACDPHPSTPGDRRALWVGFYDNNDIAGWLLNGTDSVGAGRLVIGATNAGLQYTFPPTQFTNAFAVTGVRATAVGAAAFGPAIEMQNGNNGVNQTYICYIATTSNGTAAYAYDYWPGQAAQAASVAWTGTFAANSDFVIADKIAGTTHTCTIGQGANIATPSQTAGPHAGYVILAAQYSTAAFDYLFVVEMP
jgi:hypothetical protein